MWRLRLFLPLAGLLLAPARALCDEDTECCAPGDYLTPAMVVVIVLPILGGFLCGGALLVRLCGPALDLVGWDRLRLGPAHAADWFAGPLAGETHSGEFTVELTRDASQPARLSGSAADADGPFELSLEVAGAADPTGVGAGEHAVTGEMRYESGQTRDVRMAVLSHASTAGPPALVGGWKSEGAADIMLVPDSYTGTPPRVDRKSPLARLASQPLFFVLCALSAVLNLSLPWLAGLGAEMEGLTWPAHNCVWVPLTMLALALLASGLQCMQDSHRAGLQFLGLVATGVTITEMALRLQAASIIANADVCGPFDAAMDALCSGDGGAVYGCVMIGHYQGTGCTAEELATERGYCVLTTSGSASDWASFEDDVPTMLRAQAALAFVTAALFMAPAYIVLQRVPGIDEVAPAHDKNRALRAMAKRPEHAQVLHVLAGESGGTGSGPVDNPAVSTAAGKEGYVGVV